MHQGGASWENDNEEDLVREFHVKENIHNTNDTPKSVCSFWPDVTALVPNPTNLPLTVLGVMHKQNSGALLVTGLISS